MAERWFSEQELTEMARPMMERAVEAIDAGDYDAARAICKAHQGEWLMLHDLMAESILSLVSWIQEKHGDEGVREAYEKTTTQGWKRHHRAIEKLDRKHVVELLAATWRAHSAGGVGEHPGAFSITEDEEKVTFRMNPCGSGQRLVRRGLYESAGYGRTKDATPASFDRKDFPLYCVHCSYMNESLPIQWSGFPIYPSDPPEDYSTDPCTWYWYKDPADIPERHWRRYGAVKPEAARDG